MYIQRCCFIVSAAMLIVSGSARADDAQITATFGPAQVGAAAVKSEVHEDGEPFKGSVTLVLTNNSGVAWGGLYLELFKPPQSGIDLMGVKWVAEAPYLPTKTNPPGFDSPVPWLVLDPNPTTNTGGIHELYFYSAPVLNGSTSIFTVYTDNTANAGASNNQVGVMFYPLAVPEPAAAGLLAVAAAALLRRRRM